MQVPLGIQLKAFSDSWVGCTALLTSPGFSYLVGGEAQRVLLNKGHHNACRRIYKELWLKMQEKGTLSRPFSICFWAPLRKRMTEISYLYFLLTCAEAQGSRSSLWPEKLLCCLMSCGWVSLEPECLYPLQGRSSHTSNCTCAKGVLTPLPG